MLKNIKKTVAELRRNEEGVTLVEYGIAITLAVAVGLGALNALGTEVNNELTSATGILQTT